MSRMSLYSTAGQLQHQRQQHQVQQLFGLEGSSLIGSSVSSSLAMDFSGYDQAIQELTDSLNEVKLTAALALQESQLVREQMQQGILSVLSELSTMWCQDICYQLQASPELQQAMVQPEPSGGAVTPVPSSTLQASGVGSPSGSDDQRTNFRYKTQLCKNFMSAAGASGRCAKGEACQYAHGRQELRKICEHPRYKTKMCSLQISLGVCPHGASCFFAHHPGELRGKDQF